MSVPIFDSGLKNAQVKQKKLDLQKTRNEFENFTKAAELQAAVSKTNFESSILDEKTSDRSVKLSERIYNINRIKFKEGVGSSFELVQAEQDLIQNQLKKIQSTLNVLNTKADLDKSLGVK
jgi:outer membrane protein TolC